MVHKGEDTSSTDPGVKAPAVIESRVLNMNGAAAYLGIGVCAMRELTKGGKIRTIRVGRCYRFRKVDLDAYRESAAAFAGETASGDRE